jgi:hypothetical protein
MDGQLSLSQLVHQINQQEQLSHQLCKAEALSEIALSPDFLDNAKCTVYQYLATLNDIITQSLELNEQVLKTLQQLQTSLSPIT